MCRRIERRLPFPPHHSPSSSYLLPDPYQALLLGILSSPPNVTSSHTQALLQARSVPAGITRAAWTQALDVERLGGRQGSLAGNKKGCRGILFYL